MPSDFHRFVGRIGLSLGFFAASLSAVFLFSHQFSTSHADRGQPVSNTSHSQETFQSNQFTVSPHASWITPAFLPPTSPLLRPATVQVGEKLYLISGKSAPTGTVVQTVVRYDLVTNTFTNLAPIPVASEAPAAAHLGGKIYVASGNSPHFQIYDIATDTWSAGPNTPTSDNFGAAAAAFNGKFYLIGGQSTISNATFVFTIATATWSNGVAAPAPFQLAGFTQVGSDLFLAGGRASSTTLSQRTMRFDLAANSWSFGPDLPFGRFDGALTFLNGRLFSIGGNLSSNPNGQILTQSVQQLEIASWPAGNWLDSPDNLPQKVQSPRGFVSLSQGGRLGIVGRTEVGAVPVFQRQELQPCTSASFQSLEIPPTGQIPQDVVFSDFNLDGNLDLAVSNSQSASINILLGNRFGGYTEAAGSPIPFPSTLPPGALAAGDVNHDGRPDLLVGRNDGGRFLRGNGNGTFTQTSLLPLGNQVGKIALADFNRDGDLDFVTTLGIIDDGFLIALGNGAGDFTVAAGSPVEVSSATDVAVADFNRDGKPDIVLCGGDTDRISIFLGTGTGGMTLASGSPILGFDQPRRVVAADFNQDSRPDVAVLTSNQIEVLLGNGAGGLNVAAGSPHRVGSIANDLAAGDLNNDGKIDFGVVGQVGFQFLLGDGSGGFSPLQDHDSPGMTHVALADINADGRLDFAGTGHNSRLTIGINSCLSPCQSTNWVKALNSPIQAGLNPIQVAADDFNRDGHLDLATANLNGQDTSVLLGNGTGGFNVTSVPIIGDRPTKIITGDFNRNGIPDLAILKNTSPNTISILSGNGAGGFSSIGTFSVGTSCRHLASGDFNRDGKLDLVTLNNSNTNQGTVTVRLGDGDGDFTASTTFAVGPRPVFVVVGNFNPGQGDALDLAIANELGDSVSILLGNGAGGFTSAPGSPLTGITGPTSLAINDLNDDGRQDLAVIAGGSQQVHLFFGNGAGGFTQPAGSPLAGNLINPRSVNTADVNRDGIQDVVVTDTAWIVVFYGTGGGDFLPATLVATGLSFPIASLIVQDVNHDSKPDFVTANGFANVSRTVAIFLNACCPEITIEPSVIPEVIAGTAFSQTFTQNGAIGTTTFQLIGDLPSGLTFSPSTATLSGTTTEVGTFPIAVSVTDGNGCTGIRSFDLTVGCPDFTFSPATLPVATRGEPYTQTISTSPAGAFLTISSGFLPPGLTLNSSTGVLSGTPTTRGSFTFTIQASHFGGNCVGTHSYQLTVS